MSAPAPPAPAPAAANASGTVPPPATPAWEYASTDPMATVQVPAARLPPPQPHSEPPTQAWAQAPGAGMPGQASLHSFREIRSVSNVFNGLFVLLLTVLLVGLAANVYLYVVFPPESEKWFQFAIDLDERLFLILPFQLVLYGLIYIALVLWLYRACANQRAFGAERLHLAPGELLALCFVPVANLFAIRVAMSDIWRTADIKVVPGDTWRQRPTPGRLNVLWAGPLLVLAVNIVSAVVVNNRIERDGIDEVSTIAEADFVYARNIVSLVVGLIVLNAIRRIFRDASERQHSVLRQLRAGRVTGWQRPSQSTPRPA